MTDAIQGNDSDQTINVAFWNLQNLFDLEASAIASDLEFTPVNGWNRPAFESKVRNLASVIRLMFDGQGPDLLGICEIENERLGRMLIDAIGREDYALAHVEHPDIDAIDTSLIYSKRLFDIDESATKGHLVHQRYATRDVFEVHLKVRSNDSDVVVLVSHWPSRRFGCRETEPFRVTVASHCSRLVDRNLRLCRKEYLQLKDSEVSLRKLNRRWDSNVIVMGDLNDEPWDRSVKDALHAVYSTNQLEASRSFSQGGLPSYKTYAGMTAKMFNPMWALASKPDQGTYYCENSETMLLVDQFLLSRGLLFGLNGLQPVASENGIPHVRIFTPEIMKSELNRPLSFKRESRSGYSDHFPITMTLRVLDS